MEVGFSLHTALWTLIAGIVIYYLLKISQWSWEQYQIHRYIRLHWPGMIHAHWFWGHFSHLSAVQNDPPLTIRTVKDASKKLSRGYPLFVGPILAFIRVYHEKFLKHILGGSAENFPKSRSTYKFFLPWLGEKGLLILQGKEWHRHRRLLSNSFHFDILQSYAVKMNESSKDLVKKWEERTKTDPQIEVFKDFSLMALDTTMKCFMGIETHCQKDDIEHNEYMRNIYKATQLFVKRFCTGFLNQIDWIYYRSKDGKELLKYCKEMREYSTKVIEQRRKEYADGVIIGSKLGLNKKSQRHYDFLDVLLQAQDSTGKHLTDVEISDEVNTFMFAGHDTTTSAISWISYCLAQSPEWQTKCYEEVLDVLGQKSDIELGDLSKFKYLTLCIKEGMRIYPPVLTIGRKPTSDVEVDGKCIRKDTTVLVSILGIHHNARLWPNPEVFDPLRFTPENSAKRNSYAYVPFSAGPRGCIGQHFAMNEIKICLAHVLRRFKLAVDTSVPVVDCHELVYRAKDGLHLLVTERTID